jgi:hypothetical protein
LHSIDPGTGVEIQGILVKEAIGVIEDPVGLVLWGGSDSAGKSPIFQSFNVELAADESLLGFFCGDCAPSGKRKTPGKKHELLPCLQVKQRTMRRSALPLGRRFMRPEHPEVRPLVGKLGAYRIKRDGMKSPKANKVTVLDVEHEDRHRTFTSILSTEARLSRK